MNPNHCPRPCKRGPGGFFTVFAILILCVLIFYQVIITLILPFRFNIFILFVEILILLCLLYRIVWPY